MSETALSETTMLNSLRDIHLPTEAAGGALAEYAAALGIAALAAVCCVGMLRILSVSRNSARAVSSTDEVAGSADWSNTRLRLELLHRLRQQDPKRYAELRGNLYQQGGGPDLAALQDEVWGRV